MTVIVDRRCPQCNRAVRGKTLIPYLKSLALDKKTDLCQHCKIAVRLVACFGESGEVSHHQYERIVPDTNTPADQAPTPTHRTPPCKPRPRS